MYLHYNWRAIILGAYSVRFALASAAASLLVAWQTRSIEAIIPAALALAAIIARVTAQPNLNKVEKEK